MNRNRIWLCIMPIVLFALDITLTLCGQPAAYWSGDFSRAVGCYAGELAVDQSSRLFLRISSQLCSK